MSAEDVLGRFVVRRRPGIEFRHAYTGEGRARLRLVADEPLTGLSSGRFSRPSVGVSWRADDFAADIELLGFAFTQFALPVVADAALQFDFRPTPDLRSPRAVLPLLARGAGHVVLLAPLGAPHEQIIAVGDGELTWGWHGDLDRVPAGFATELGLYVGSSVGEVLEAWRTDLAPVPRPPSTNPLMTHLSYWTDNGAAYWYRTEPGGTIAESVAEVVADLRRQEVPVHAVELDSWFYEHEHPRPISVVGYPAEVPSSGAMSWSPRPDAFPRDAGGRDPLDGFADRLGRPPLVLHARHMSPSSPDVDDGWWLGEIAALPADPSYFRGWFDDARRWGAVCIEQDWMMVVWFGVPDVRAEPGRAAAWQRALDRSAGETGVDLLWCMATPADLVHAARLEHVVAVRTCDDYRFADDPALLWTWFLTVNRLAATLGLRVFKDCFFSNADVGPDADPIDGDPHAELEALLAALSGGPVGIGDRLGRTDRGVVMRTCDDDGRLRPVDRPIALIDDCMFGAPARGEGLAWASTTATDAAGRVWTYVVAINTATERREIVDRRRLEEFDVAPGEVVVWDWRHRTSRRDPTIETRLAPRGWALFVCCPIDADDELRDVVGDRDRYVTTPAARE